MCERFPKDMGKYLYKLIRSLTGEVH
jgi:hypothetical protein